MTATNKITTTTEFHATATLRNAPSIHASIKLRVSVENGKITKMVAVSADLAGSTVKFDDLSDVSTMTIKTTARFFETVDALEARVPVGASIATSKKRLILAAQFAEKSQPRFVARLLREFATTTDYGEIFIGSLSN